MTAVVLVLLLAAAWVAVLVVRAGDRLRVAQARRELAFSRAFGAGVLVDQFNRDSAFSGSRRPASGLGTSHLAPTRVPLRGRGRAAERSGGAS